MIIIKNNLIPMKGFRALTLYPFIFVRKDANYDNKCDRHERIHSRQQVEMLIIPFVLWYVIEWVVKWIYYRNRITAYKNVSFEREAYSNQGRVSYLSERKPFSWRKYI